MTGNPTPITNSSELTILFVDDSEEDARRFSEQLRDQGLPHRAFRADEPAALGQLLEDAQPDVVISERRTRQISPREARRIVQQHDPALPFIYLTGQVSDATAARELGSDGTDYVLKDRPGRLASAIRQAHRGGDERARRRTAETAHAELFDRTPVGLYRSSPEGKLLAANRHLAQMFGYSTVHELLAVPVWDLYVDRSDRERALEEVDRNGVVEGTEQRQKRKDGSTFWVRDSVRAIRRSDGSVAYHEGAMYDITLAIEARQSLLQASRTLTMGEEVAHVGSWDFDLSTATLSWSEELFRILGLGNGVVSPSFQVLIERIHPDDRDRILRTFQEGMSSGSGFRYEGRIVRPSGEVRWVRTISRVQTDGAGIPTRVHGIAQDITEEVLVREELEASEARARSIVDSALDCIVLMDHTGAIIEFNRSAEEAFGYSREEVMGRPVTMLMPERYRNSHEKGLETARRTGTVPLAGRRLQLPALRSDGTEFMTELTIAPVKGANPARFVGYLRDISEALDERARGSS